MGQTKALFLEDVERGYLMDIPFLMEKEQELYEEFYREEKKIIVNLKYGKSRGIITRRNNGNKSKPFRAVIKCRNRGKSLVYSQPVQYGNKPRISRKYSGARVETKTYSERLPF